MITYETRLVAALRSYGADDRLVDEARATLQDFPGDEEGLTREFGEPEDYARALKPEGHPKEKVAFILGGVVLAVVAWMVLRWADDAGRWTFEGSSLLQYLIPLVFLAGGVLAEFWRYQRQGQR